MYQLKELTKKNINNFLKQTEKDNESHFQFHNLVHEQYTTIDEVNKRIKEIVNETAN